VTVQIVSFFVMRPFDSADFPMIASVRKHKKCDQKIAFHFPYRSYCCCTDKIKCPGNDTNPAEKWAMQGKVREFHKMLNGWVKN